MDGEKPSVRVSGTVFVDSTTPIDIKVTGQPIETKITGDVPISWPDPLNVKVVNTPTVTVGNTVDVSLPVLVTTEISAIAASAATTAGATTAGAASLLEIATAAPVIATATTATATACAATAASTAATAGSTSSCASTLGNIETTLGDIKPLIDDIQGDTATMVLASAQIVSIIEILQGYQQRMAQNLDSIKLSASASATEATLAKISTDLIGSATGVITVLDAILADLTTNGTTLQGIENAINDYAVYHKTTRVLGSYVRVLYNGGSSRTVEVRRACNVSDLLAAAASPGTGAGNVSMFALTNVAQPNTATYIGDSANKVLGTTQGLISGVPGMNVAQV